MNIIQKIFGHKHKHKHDWKKTHYFSKDDGLMCNICNMHVLKCVKCNALKCKCGVLP